MGDERLKEQDVYVSYSGWQDSIQVLPSSDGISTCIYFGQMGVCLTPGAMDVLLAKIKKARNGNH